MPPTLPEQIFKAVTRVKGQADLLDLLRDALEWEIPEAVESFEDLGYDWTEPESKAEVRQLLPGQPCGIFLVVFPNKPAFRTELRRTLRRLVSNRRDPSRPAWQHENLLFLCITGDYKSITFAHFRGETAATARLATFGWSAGESHIYTLCKHNLPALVWPANAAGFSDWSAAFDVEAVTKSFFKEYREVFEHVESKATDVPKGEKRRLYTQRLFNRLLFLYFIQRKGWLEFGGSQSYLRSLFNAAEAAKENFLNERLYWAFFYGLNNGMEDEASHSQTELIERRGNVKFLNGGLFDLESEYDVQRDDKMKLGVTIPNAAFAKVLDLFERYNFTVAESTPLDVEVAVDPEMLGKVFEELVTGRHESGSYYTPRPIVSFMCREALKYYLQPTVADEAAVAKFVDDGDPAGLTAPEDVLAALKRVRVCDPACGSGAYLLGMMQELLRLREALFAAHAKDHKSIYDRKLEIIQNNLYGVDLDEFAVNIAKLRLWLSLAVDYTGSKPEPLPNLDFKIERGDSLTAPDPQSVSDLFRSTIDMFSKELTDLKGKFIKSSGTEKKKQAAQIREIEAKLRANLLDNCPPGAIDWRVAFAEVFDEGGFDIALENPPYVRMELFKNDKPTLKKNFPAVYDGSADLYVYFFARTHQILKPGGVACVITTNKWLKAGYAEGLRRFFSESAWVSAVVDFGHAKQIFQSADVFPSIAVFRKPSFAEAPLISRICAIPRDELDLENVGDQIHETSFEMPRNHFAGNAWTLELPATLAILEKIKQAGVPLHEFVGAGPLYGIKTGCNEAFIVDTPTRTKLVSAHASSEAVLRKYLRGQDVDRWVSTWSGEWMIFAVRGIKIDAYPAIKKHLQQFRDKLEPKPSGFEGKWNGRASGNNKWYGRVPKKGCWQTRVVIP